jgi:hypothetical protein
MWVCVGDPSSFAAVIEKKQTWLALAGACRHSPRTLTLCIPTPPATDFFFLFLFVRFSFCLLGFLLFFLLFFSIMLKKKGFWLSSSVSVFRVCLFC